MSTTSVDQSKQRGMVAIMITMILMIVISLIVLGFAQISRRNQRQSLDRQLSTQAFYAAETGVNDAAELINTAIANGLPVADKPSCSPDPGGFYAGLNPTISATDGVAYTCLMVDTTPSSLIYSTVGTTGTVIPVIATSGTIGSIQLTWQSKGGSATPAATCPTGTTSVFGTTGSWSCGYGVLRFDLLPSSVAYGITTLRTSTMTAFVVPLRPGSVGTANPVSYAGGGASDLQGVVCSNSSCSLVINFAAPQSQYYMRITSLYKDVSLQVTAYAAANASGASLSLQGAQALIDVTGKARDVLRRIQVRAPVAGAGTNLLSDYAIQSAESICKRFSVMDGFSQNDASNALPGVENTTTNPLCKPYP